MSGFRNHGFWVGVMLFVLLGWAGGCEQALFPEESPRTQYERYDRMHGRYVNPEIAGPGGRTRPSLRDRLTPASP